MVGMMMALDSRKRLDGLINSTKVASDIPSKLARLRQLKNDLLPADPVVLSELLPRILDLQSDRFSPIRKFITQMVGEIGLKHIDLLPQIVPLLITVLTDDTPAVVRQSITCAIDLFRISLVKIAIKGLYSSEIDNSLESLWTWMLKFKEEIYSIAVHGNGGMSLLALKFIVEVILLYTPDPNGSSEPPTIEENSVDFNISWLRGGHPMLNIRDFSTEASQSLGLLLDQLRFPKVKSLNNAKIIVLINSLSTIAKRRPAFYGRILPVLLGLDRSGTIFNGLHAPGVHYALKNAFLTCLKCSHPGALPWRDPLIGAVREMKVGGVAEPSLHQVSTVNGSVKEELGDDHFTKDEKTTVERTSDIMNSNLGKKRSGEPDSCDLKEDGNGSGKRARPTPNVSESEKSFKEMERKIDVSKHNESSGTSSTGDVDTGPAQQLVAMFGALVAQGEKAIGSLQILISSISADLLAEVVIANMRFLPPHQPDAGDGELLQNMCIVGSDADAQVKYPPSFVIDVLSLSSTFPPFASLLDSAGSLSDPMKSEEEEDHHAVPTVDSAGTTHDSENATRQTSLQDFKVSISEAEEVCSINRSTLHDVDHSESGIPGLDSSVQSDGLSESVVTPSLASFGFDDSNLENISNLDPSSSLKLSVSREKSEELSPKAVVSDVNSLASSTATSEGLSFQMVLPKMSAPVVDLVDEEKDELLRLAFVHIVEAYKQIAVAGGLQARFSLLAYLGVQYPLELEPWKVLQNHILADYVNNEGHKLTLRVLYRLFGEAEEEHDFFSSTTAASVYETFLLTVAETLKDSFPPSDKSLSRLLGEAPYLPKSVINLLECMCSPGNSENADKDLQSGDRVTQGLSTVWSLILLRPPIRDVCLKIALQSVIRSNLQQAALSALRRLPLDPGNPAFLHRAVQGVSFADPVAVRQALEMLSELAARDPYAVAMSLGKLVEPGGALLDVLHLHDVLARVSLARLCHSISRARALDERPDIKSLFNSVLYQLLLDPSERVCFEAILCVLGKSDNTERTEERAAGWYRLTREFLKLPEAPSKGTSKDKSQKIRRPQPLIKLVMRRLESSFRSFSRPVLHAAARVVQEMGRSRAAAFSFGLQDIDEGAFVNSFSEGADQDSDANENSHPESIRRTSSVANGRGEKDTIASLLASLMEVVRTTVACECVFVRAMVIKALIWMQSPHDSFDELESIIASELSDPAWPAGLLNDILLTLHARFKATPDMAVTLLQIARVFATKVPGKIDADVLQLLWKTCLVGAGSDWKHTALEAVTLVLDLPPPQPDSMTSITSVDRVAASDPKSALALQRLVQAAVWFLGENANYAASEYAWESATPPGTALMMLDADKMVAAAGSRNPTLAGALTRLQRSAFSGSWEIRLIAAQALTTVAIRSGEPYRLQIYDFLHSLAQGGLHSQFSEMHLSNGEDQGASGTGVGVLISPMIKVLDEMYRAQDDLIKDIRYHDNAKKEWTDEELKKLYETHERLLDLVSLFCFVPRAKYLPLGPISAKLIDIYRTRHNISASTGLSDPAVATGISDLIYESSKPAINEPDALDDDLVNAWAANLGDDGLLGSSAPAMSRVNEFLAGAGTDAPDVDEENIISRPSVSYDDMWAKTLLESSELEEDDARSTGSSSPESTGSVETSISSHFGGMNYPSLFSSRPSYGGTQTSERSGASRFSNPTIHEGFNSPTREDPPPYSPPQMQRYESFENPLAGRGSQSFGSQDDRASSGNPQYGSALYDFTAGGDDELSLTAGEEVEIEYEVDGWFYVKKKRPGRDGKMAGLVPVLYVNQP